MPMWWLALSTRRMQYQKDAEKIAQVQRGILSISQKEQPFDVFICYKETDENGNRTVDSTLAQEIYYQLMDQGRRVFFVRITLEDKAGQEYEPYIFAALHSAKVMVVVGTKPEYLNAVWVKNEWSRYLALMKHDRKRLLIPCYRDMDPYDLPEQLSVLQSYDMSKIGFIQDLIRGIAKVLDADKKPEKIEEKETVIIQGEGGANLTALLKRGQQALEDEDWEKADGFFDQALNINAESGEAFFGKAMAELHDRNRKVFIDARSVNQDIDPKYLELPKAGENVLKLNGKNIAEFGAKAAALIGDAVSKGELPPAIQIGDVTEACPRDDKRIEQTASKYELPGYLTRAEIRKGFFEEGDMRKYISAASIRRLYQADWETRLKTQNKNLVRAKQYAKGVFAEELSGIYGEIDSILARRLEEAEARDKAVAAKKREEYENFLELEEKKAAEQNELAVKLRDADYQNAQTAEEHATTQTAFLEAAEQYEKVKSYRDAPERAETCRKKAAEAERVKKEKEVRKARARRQFMKKAMATVAGIVVIAVVSFTVNDKVLQPFLKYTKAENLMNAGEYEAAAEVFAALGNYSDAQDKRWEAKYAEAESLLNAGKSGEAFKAFENLKNYSDAADKVKEIKYKAAENLLEAGRYEDAAKAFEELGNYSDALDRVQEAETDNLEKKYQAAVSLMNQGKYTEANAEFEKIRGYKDVDALLEENDLKYIPGKEITFGSYEQDGNIDNGAEKIEWLILDKAC